MSSAWEILDTLDKEELIDLIVEYGDNGYYPLDLFLLRSKHEYTAGELENHWKAR